MPKPITRRVGKRSARAVLATGVAALLFGSFAERAEAQLSLSGTNYTQTFDGIGTALPTGWTVNTGATAASLGTSSTFTTTQNTWGNTTGAFKNLASSDGLTSGASTTLQNNSTDRALGIRQTGAFGDPGAAFTLQLTNTTGFTNFALSFSAQMLSVQNYSTTWTLQYGVGTSPTSFVDLATYTDPGAFGSTSVTAGSAISGIANQSQTVWIRLVALSAATGSNSRDTFAIDDFNLTWSSATPTLYWDANGGAGAGGSGTWDTGMSNWNTAADGSGSLVNFTSANPVVFGGAAGTVTLATGGVTASGGVTFETAGYLVKSDAPADKLTLTTTNTITVNAAAEISAGIDGTIGVNKAGAATLTLSGANTFTGPVTISAGTLAIAADSALGDPANDVVLGGGTLQATGDLALNAGRDFSGSGGLSVQTGKTLTINGAVSTTALTLRDTGTVSVTGDFNASALTIADGGTLSLSGATKTAGGIVFNAAGTVSAGIGGTLSLPGSVTTNFATGTATIAGNVNLGATNTVNRIFTIAAGGTLVVTGDVSLDGSGGTGTSGRLQKSGDGTLDLQGNNAALFGVRIGTAGTGAASGGKLVIHNGSALGTADVQFNGGTLDVQGGAVSTPVKLSLGAGAGGISDTISGSPITFAGAYVFRASGVTYQHLLNLNTDVTIAGAFEASPASTGASTGLTLGGPGKLTLANATNGNDVPIVIAGPTLEVMGSLASAVSVQNGTLNAVGPIAGLVTIGDNTGSGDAILSVGSTIDTLTLDALTLNSDAVVRFELNSDTLARNRIMATGLVDLGTSWTTLQLIDLGNTPLAAGLNFTLIDHAGGGATSGVFKDFAEGATVFAGVNSFIIHYGVGSSGQDVQLVSVPEPGAGVLALASLAGMLGLRRRRCA